MENHFFWRIQLKNFALSNHEPTILDSSKEKNNTFKLNNTDETIQTFEMAIKEDRKKKQKKTILIVWKMTKEQREDLIELSTWEDLIITRADKNEVTVIWGIDEYRKETNNQRNNKEFYYELPTEPFEDHQDTIINSLNDMVGKKSNRQRNIRDTKIPQRKTCPLLSATEYT